MRYEPRKAAQLLAYLLLKTGGNKLNVLKAMKLVYLVDRESIKRFGFPVLNEQRFSMPHGPVNSMTYNYLSGVCNAEGTGWSDFISDRQNHNIGLARKNIVVDELDELSDADIECANSVWSTFGKMGVWELRDWTHDPANIPEWEDPHGGSSLIPLQRIMNAVGNKEARQFTEIADDLRQIDNIFAQARAM